MPEARFRVEGFPKSQPRPRAFAASGKARVYNPGTAEGWKSAIAEASRAYKPDAAIVGPVALRTIFDMPRPKSHYGTGRNAGKLKRSAPLKHTTRPDADNLLKPVLDALKILGWWRDDSQVYYVEARKQYALRGEGPGAWVTVLWEPQ